jgi:hypothetical protein
MVAPAIAFLVRHISVGPRVPVHAGIEIVVNRGYEIRNLIPAKKSAQFKADFASVPRRSPAGLAVRCEEQSGRL